MKILAIRGKNLASLESFDVALESGALSHTGIFAITGPTGAGKSTLLDAMCVALFDRTPRLSNQAGVPIGSAEQDDAHRVRANDVRGLLRRGCGEGFAEVDFLGKDDHAYRSRWEVRRARRSATGKLQNAVLTLSELDTGRVISTAKKTETLRAIEDCLGLSFEQFRRSALLAQNDFAAFLRADKDERSELLERMTGTEVYTKVSVAAFRRAAEEAKALELLQEAADTNALLSEEDRAAMLAKQAELKTEDKTRRESLLALQAALRWYAEHRKASQSLHEAKERAEQSKLALDALRADEAELKLARQARRHMGLVDATKLRRQEAEQAIAAHALAQGQLAGAEKTLQTAQAEVKAARALVEEARAKYIAELQAEKAQLEAKRSEIATWLRDNDALRGAGGEHEDLAGMSAPELDARAPSLAEGMAGQDKAAALLGAELVGAKTSLDAVKAQHQEARSKLAAIDVPALRELVGTISESARDVEWLAELVVKAQQCHEQLQAARQEEAKLREQVSELAGGGEGFAVLLRSKRDQLGEAEGSFDRIRLALDFSQQRSELKSGESCPLCGSQEHPFAGDSQVVDTIVGEQRQRVETLRAELEGLSKSEARRESTLASATQALGRALDDVKLHTASGAAFATSYSESTVGESFREHELLGPGLPVAIAARRDELAASLQKQKAALALGEAAEAKLQALALQVEDKQQGWERKREALAAAERAQLAARERYGACQAQRYRSRVQAQQAGQARLDVIATKLAGAATAHFPATETRLQAATLAEQEAGKHLAGAQSALASAAKRIEATQEAIVDCDRQLEEALDSLDCSWAEFGRRLSLSEEAMQAIDDALLAARRAAAEAEGSLRQCSQRIAELEGQGRPELAEEMARSEELALQSELEQRAEALLELGAKLKADTQARERRDDLDKRLHKAVARAHTFRTLSDLIGSADGKKFRVFAQSLTLDTLLHGANQHLAELSPRYLLQRVPGHDLDLQIVDRDLGDDVRSVNSLSGGEGFLISLALALGLSSLASREVRVESLLVDEGFGSLDEDTLEIALGVLDSLQATGRKVGLISHVPGFADRIGAQVRITPEGGGKSSVQVCGPGL